MLIGRPVGDAAGGYRAFFFTRDGFLGNDALAPEHEADASPRQGKVTVTLSYGVYDAGDTAGAAERPQARAVRLEGDAHPRAGHDPARQRPLPAPHG